MNTDISEIPALLRSRLQHVVGEMENQSDLAACFRPDRLSFDDLMHQLHEYVDDAAEYGVAYESIVVTLEEIPFVVSGQAAVSLLEVGLLLRYKTNRDIDAIYDSQG